MSTENNIERNLMLYCQDSGSDKFYMLQINKVEGGFMLYYANGKRGQAIKLNKITNTPTTLEDANAQFDKKEKAKRKGKRGKSIYKESCDGGDTLEVNKDAGNQSGIEVQLLNKVNEAQARALCHDNNWVAQEKHDGERRPVLIKDGVAQGTNLYGEFTGGMKTQTAQGIETAVDMILDTEDLGKELLAFDLLSLEGKCLRHLGFMARAKLAEKACLSHTTISFSPIAVTTEEKLALLERMIEENREGMVFKRADAPVTVGRPNSGGDQLKYKLVEEASVIVAGINKQRSFQMELIDDNGERVPVGNCPIPANQAIPEVGSVIEVEYLYAYRGGCMIQPTFNKPRPDQRIEECRQSQLKYKRDAA